MSEEQRSKKTLLYVAIGNSLTAGIGSGFAPGFVRRYQQLAEGALKRCIVPRVFARPGATSGDIRRIIGHPRIRQSLQAASIVTISAGGNDLIQAARIYFRTQDLEVLEQALKRCHENISHMLRELKKIKAEEKQPYIIRLIDLYNPYPHMEIGWDWVQKFNHYLGSFVQGNVAMTHIFEAFKGKERELIALDRLHPNARGHQVIAEQLHGLGYGQIA